MLKLNAQKTEGEKDDKDEDEGEKKEEDAHSQESKDSMNSILNRFMTDSLPNDFEEKRQQITDQK